MSKKKKMLTILGTRPEIVKLSPLIPKLDREFKQVLVHTGQHYSKNMSEDFFHDLKLRKPDYNLKVGSSTHGRQVGRMLDRLEQVILKERPDFVLVQGDTNTTLAGALTAAKHNIPVVHVEAGCRCGRPTPEETNRVIVSRITDLHFAIDQETKSHLAQEGIKKNVHIFSNTAYEACKNISDRLGSSQLVKKHKLQGKEFALVTIHRAENRSDPELMKKVFEVLNTLSEEIDILFPVHPGTRKMIGQMKLKVSERVHLDRPVAYLEFLSILKDAKYVLADSGGIVDESVTLKKPLLIFRSETERNEVVAAGKAHLVSPKLSRNSLLKKIRQLTSEKSLANMKKAKLKVDYNVADKMIKLMKKRYGAD